MSPLSALARLAVCASLFFAADARAADDDAKAEHVAEFPANWFTSSKKAIHGEMEGRPAPRLFVDGFMNGNPMQNGLAGKIVVVDFFATWCPPCVKAVPENNAIARKYAGDGVVFLGVCTSSGQENLPQFVRENNLVYPVARDPGERTKTAWNISFYPTVMLVDRNGIIRAAGVTASRVDAAVAELLKEQPDPGKQAASEVRAALGDDHLEGDAERRAAMEEHLEGQMMPALQAERWADARDIKNGQAMPEDARLVVVTFLPTNDAAELERLATLQSELREQGVIVIAVVSDRPDRRARPTPGAATVATAYDRSGRTASTFGVDEGEVETYLVHPSGIVLAGDVAESSVEEAVAATLGVLQQ